MINNSLTRKLDQVGLEIYSSLHTHNYDNVQKRKELLGKLSYSYTSGMFVSHKISMVSSFLQKHKMLQMILVNFAARSAIQGIMMAAGSINGAITAVDFSNVGVGLAVGTMGITVEKELDPKIEEDTDTVTKIYDDSRMDMSAFLGSNPEAAKSFYYNVYAETISSSGVRAEDDNTPHDTAKRLDDVCSTCNIYQHVMFRMGLYTPTLPVPETEYAELREDLRKHHWIPWYTGGTWLRRQNNEYEMDTITMKEYNNQLDEEHSALLRSWDKGWERALLSVGGVINYAETQVRYLCHNIVKIISEGARLLQSLHNMKAVATLTDEERAAVSGDSMAADIAKRERQEYEDSNLVYKLVLNAKYAAIRSFNFTWDGVNVVHSIFNILVNTWSALTNPIVLTSVLGYVWKSTYDNYSKKQHGSMSSALYASWDSSRAVVNVATLGWSSDKIPRARDFLVDDIPVATAIAAGTEVGIVKLKALTNLDNAPKKGGKKEEDMVFDIDDNQICLTAEQREVHLLEEQRDREAYLLRQADLDRELGSNIIIEVDNRESQKPVGYISRQHSFEKDSLEELSSSFDLLEVPPPQKALPPQKAPQKAPHVVAWTYGLDCERLETNLPYGLKYYQIGNPLTFNRVLKWFGGKAISMRSDSGLLYNYLTKSISKCYQQKIVRMMRSEFPSVRAWKTVSYLREHHKIWINQCVKTKNTFLDFGATAESTIRDVTGEMLTKDEQRQAWDSSTASVTGLVFIGGAEKKDISTFSTLLHFINMCFKLNFPNQPLPFSAADTANPGNVLPEFNNCQMCYMSGGKPLFAAATDILRNSVVYDGARSIKFSDANPFEQSGGYKSITLFGEPYDPMAVFKIGKTLATIWNTTDESAIPESYRVKDKTSHGFLPFTNEWRRAYEPSDHKFEELFTRIVEWEKTYVVDSVTVEDDEYISVAPEHYLCNILLNEGILTDFNVAIDLCDIFKSYQSIFGSNAYLDADADVLFKKIGMSNRCKYMQSRQSGKITLTDDSPWVWRMNKNSHTLKVIEKEMVKLGTNKGITYAYHDMPDAKLSPFCFDDIFEASMWDLTGIHQDSEFREANESILDRYMCCHKTNRSESSSGVILTEVELWNRFKDQISPAFNMLLPEKPTTDNSWIFKRELADIKKSQLGLMFGTDNTWHFKHRIYEGIYNTYSRFEKDLNWICRYIAPALVRAMVDYPDPMAFETSCGMTAALDDAIEDLEIRIQTYVDDRVTPDVGCTLRWVMSEVTLHVWLVMIRSEPDLWNGIRMLMGESPNPVINQPSEPCVRIGAGRSQFYVPTWKVVEMDRHMAFMTKALSMTAVRPYADNGVSYQRYMTHDIMIKSVDNVKSDSDNNRAYDSRYPGVWLKGDSSPECLSYETMRHHTLVALEYDALAEFGETHLYDVKSEVKDVNRCPPSAVIGLYLYGDVLAYYDSAPMSVSLLAKWISSCQSSSVENCGMKMPTSKPILAPSEEFSGVSFNFNRDKIAAMAAIRYKQTGVFKSTVKKEEKLPRQDILKLIEPSVGVDDFKDVLRPIMTNLYGIRHHIRHILFALDSWSDLSLDHKEYFKSMIVGLKRNNDTSENELATNVLRLTEFVREKTVAETKSPHLFRPIEVTPELMNVIANNMGLTAENARETLELSKGVTYVDMSDSYKSYVKNRVLSSEFLDIAQKAYDLVCTLENSGYALKSMLPWVSKTWPSLRTRSELMFWGIVKVMEDFKDAYEPQRTMIILDVAARTKALMKNMSEKTSYKIGDITPDHISGLCNLIVEYCGGKDYMSTVHINVVGPNILSNADHRVKLRELDFELDTFLGDSLLGLYREHKELLVPTHWTSKIATGVVSSLNVMIHGRRPSILGGTREDEISAGSAVLDSSGGWFGAEFAESLLKILIVIIACMICYVIYVRKEETEAFKPRKKVRQLNE